MARVTLPLYRRIRDAQLEPVIIVTETVVATTNMSIVTPALASSIGYPKANLAGRVWGMQIELIHQHHHP